VADPGLHSSALSTAAPAPDAPGGGIASARRRGALLRHGRERLQLRRRAAEEARAILEATPGSICCRFGHGCDAHGHSRPPVSAAAANAAAVGGGNPVIYSTQDIEAASAQVAAACGAAGGGGTGAARYMDWLLRVTSQQAEVSTLIEVGPATLCFDARGLRKRHQAVRWYKWHAHASI
jgi:hypothetical protein